VELQQRSVEYFSLTQLHQSTLKEVLVRGRTPPCPESVLTSARSDQAEMPKFPERASALERRVAGGDQEVPESQQDLSRPSMPEVLAPQPAALQSLVDLGEVYASTAPAPRPAPMNALDLLSQLEEPRAQPAADLLGGLDDFLGGGKVVPAAPATATPVLPLQDPQAWLNKLVTADSGVLYEDPYVQLGVKNEWRQNQGRITLFLGNKYTSPLASLRAEVHQVEGLRVDLFALPALVGAGQQVTVQLAVACVAAFAAPPSLTLAYTLADTQQHVSFRLRLPVFATKFLGPAPAMEKTAFYESWRTLAGAQKLESILQVNASLASLPAWHSLLRALRLSVLPDVDPNPLNLFAALHRAPRVGREKRGAIQANGRLTRRRACGGRQSLHPASVRVNETHCLLRSVIFLVLLSLPATLTPLSPSREALQALRPLPPPRGSAPAHARTVRPACACTAQHSQ
jgi:AP-2 complex subunit alpha